MKKRQLVTHRVIAGKPKNKSPEVAYILSGFSVYHLFVATPVSELKS
jgi:hypothetical protein